MITDSEFKDLVKRVEKIERLAGKAGSTTKRARDATDVVYPSVPVSFLNKIKIKKFPSGHAVALALVMYFAKGVVGEGTDQKTFETTWKKLNRVIGISLKPMYLARARDKGWIDGPGKKKGGKIILLEDGPSEFDSILEKISKK